MWYNTKMTEQNIKANIAAIRAELDTYFAIGDRDSLIKSIALTDQSWEELFRKDDGLRYSYLFQKIWMDETARGEDSIFADVRSVADVEKKHRLLRHALFRLENDYPVDMCLEALHTLSTMHLSNTALRIILEQHVEDGDKVLARIGEISAMHA